VYPQLPIPVSTQSPLERTAVEVGTALETLIRRQQEDNVEVIQPDVVFADAFECLKPPSISIPNYLLRFVTRLDLEEPCYIAAFIYVLRLQEDDKIVITAKNVHRLILISFCAAMKIFDDKPYKNKDLAIVGGISTKELCDLEVAFCLKADFNFQIEPNDYESYREQMAKLAGVRRSVPPALSARIRASQRRLLDTKEAKSKMPDEEATSAQHKTVSVLNEPAPWSTRIRSALRFDRKARD